MSGANKPDGKNAQQRVSFTRAGADRIARAVRRVEQGDRRSNSLTFEKRYQAANATSAGTTLTTSAMTVITNVALSTANLTFSVSDVIVVGFTTTSSIAIPIEQCPSVAVSAEGQAFFYG